MSLVPNTSLRYRSDYPDPFYDAASGEVKMSATDELILKKLLKEARQECEKYYRRCVNQRKELRRFNQLIKAYWAGANVGFDAARRNEYRKKMIDAFGIENVVKAERGEINRVP